jgi:hypothetical protein
MLARAVNENPSLTTRSGMWAIGTRTAESINTVDHLLHYAYGEEDDSKSEGRVQSSKRKG